MIGLLYLDDYKRGEEARFRTAGVPCVRLESTAVLRGSPLPPVDPETVFELRGDRTTAVDYAALYRQLERSGIQIGTSPDSFRVGGDFRKQYALLKSLSPRAAIADAGANPQEVVRALLDAEVRFPVFLRSEVESAAKYVGVEGCVLRTPNEGEVVRVTGNLREHVSGFTTLIFKEMATIESDPETGGPLEYRAVGMGGSLVAFDFPESPDDKRQAPGSLGLQNFAQQAFSQLARGSGTGAFFLDVAATTGGPMVVECKNFFNGSVRAVGVVGHALAEGAKHHH